MPVVERAIEGSPLTQGDVLRGVPFVLLNESEQPGLDAQPPYALVISRPCKALREDVIVVAPVVPFPFDLAEISKTAQTPLGGLDRTRRFLAGLRDGIKGGDFTDALYLGSIEGGDTKRFAAQLTTLATVRVPMDGAQRAAWIERRRIARLGVDFLRDLHTRLALTFTRLGFDDYTWFSDADLQVMISAGEAEVAHLRTEFLQAEQSIQRSEAIHSPVKQQQRDALKSKHAAVEEAEERLRPYIEERDRRAAAR